MPDLNAIADAGGWVVAVFVLLLMVEGFRREWWVPGTVYRREVTRGDAAEHSAEDAARATEASAKANRDLARQFGRLQRRLGAPDEPD